MAEIDNRYFNGELISQYNPVNMRGLISQQDVDASILVEITQEN